jgi:hypothetical protein
LVSESSARVAGIAPCCLCGDPAGKPHGRGGVRPSRWTLARFGIDGSGCYSCYGRLDGEARRESVKEGVPTTPNEVRRLALAVHSGLAAKGDRIEDARLTEVERGPATVSPAEGARLARKEFKATIFGGWA